jgi:hypothetical protein
MGVSPSSQARSRTARNTVFTTNASWAFDRLPRAGDELVINVEARSGHAARQLAPPGPRGRGARCDGADAGAGPA